MLVIITFYTAQVAAALISDRQAATIASFDHVRAADLHACGLASMETALKAMFPGKLSVVSKGAVPKG